MKIVKLDLSGIASALLRSTPPSPTGDNAFIKIVVQVIRKI